MIPGLTSLSRQRLRLVSKPITPKGARLNSTSFSSGWCGAWSLAMASTVPSASPATSASRSLAERSGGLILVSVEKPLSATA